MACFVGIDWGNEEHEVCVLDVGGKVLSKHRIKHEPESVSRLIEGLGELRGVVFAIERKDGLLVDALLDSGAEVFHINPRQLDRFRDRFSASGAKNDTLDARALADAARTDLRAFHRVNPRPAEIVELRGVARLHSALTEQRVRLENQAQEALSRYYRAFLAIDISTNWGRELFERAPNPEAARRLRLPELERIMGRAKKYTPTELRDLLSSPTFRPAPGVAMAEQLAATSAVRQLTVVVEQLRIVDQRMQELLDVVSAAPRGTALGEWAIAATALRSMPGVGSKIASTILAEAPEALRQGSYHELRTNAGTAPVSKSTGKRSKTPTVTMRYACNGHLRNAMHYWGQKAADAEPSWASYRRRCLERGHSPARANRQVADRLLRTLAAIIRKGSVYDPLRWTQPQS